MQKDTTFIAITLAILIAITLSTPQATTAAITNITEATPNGISIGEIGSISHDTAPEIAGISSNSEISAIEGLIHKLPSSRIIDQSSNPHTISLA